MSSLCQKETEKIELITQATSIKAEQDHKTDVPHQGCALGRIWCPVSGCENYRGRGYKYSYFKKHICAHNAILVQSAEEREIKSHACFQIGEPMFCAKVAAEW